MDIVELGNLVSRMNAAAGFLRSQNGSCDPKVRQQLVSDIQSMARQVLRIDTSQLLVIHSSQAEKMRLTASQLSREFAQ